MVWQHLRQLFLLRWDKFHPHPHFQHHPQGHLKFHHRRPKIHQHLVFQLHSPL